MTKPSDTPRRPAHRKPRSPAHALAWVPLLIAVTACGGGAEDDAPIVARSPLLRTSAFAETAPPRFEVHLETSSGLVIIDVHREWAPNGADRFYSLARGGFYDDARVYRVLEGFMAQFGIHADPYVTRAWKNEFIVDDPLVVSNTRGRVAFAKGGVHTRTVELFVSTGNNTPLDDQGFTPIGEVIEGMDVVDSFYAAYGDGPPRGDGPYSAMAAARGNEYLDADFPELTRIISATVVPGS